MMHHNTYSELAQLLTQATSLAGGAADVMQRITQLKVFLVSEYLHFRAHDGADDEVEARQFAFRFLQHLHRSRDLYMNHYRARVAVGFRNLADRHKEPSWRGTPFRPGVPWQSGDGYTSQEVETLFAEAAAYFQPARLDPPRQFAAPLRVVDLSAQGEPFRYEQLLTGAGLRSGLHFFSADGQPLRLRVVFPEPRNEPQVGNPEARVWIHDAAGTVVYRHAATVTADQCQWDVEAPLPGPGEYIVTAGARNVRFAFPPSMTVFLRDPGDIRGRLPQWFFVPQDVTEIQGYLDKGLTVTLRSPSGRTLAIEGDRTRLLRVPVAPEERGKLWQLQQAASLRFFNVPNLFALDPARTVVPETLSTEIRGSR